MVHILWFTLPLTGTFAHHRHHIKRKSLHACNIDISGTVYGLVESGERIS